MSLRVLGAGAVLVGASFLWGYAAARKGIFPHALLVAAKRAVVGEEAPAPVAQPFQEQGFWMKLRQPGGLSAEDTLDTLDKLGYAGTYEEADPEQGGPVVTDYDPARAQPGHNLIVSAHEPSVQLANMEGEVLHEWIFSFDDVPVPEGYEAPGIFGSRCFRRARLLADGHVLVIFERMALLELDKDSNLVWSQVGYFHHDLDVTPDGTIHALTHEVHVVPRIDETRESFEDFVTTLSPEGELLGRFSLLEALERSDWAPLLENRNPERQDIFHTNTIAVLDGSLAHLSPHYAAGHLLVSIHALDTIAIVDPREERVVWALTGMWRKQHEPVLLPSGNMLLFDNMGHGGWSKVIEFDPFTQHIHWAFEGSEANDFYSEVLGSCARLANGNTLITESVMGRAFEVTPGGEVVWRWTTPYRVERDDFVGIAVLMEIERLEPDVDLSWLAE